MAFTGRDDTWDYALENPLFPDELTDESYFREQLHKEKSAHLKTQSELKSVEQQNTQLKMQLESMVAQHQNTRALAQAEIDNLRQQLKQFQSQQIKLKQTNRALQHASEMKFSEYEAEIKKEQTEKLEQQQQVRTLVRKVDSNEAKLKKQEKMLVDEMSTTHRLKSRLAQNANTQQQGSSSSNSSETASQMDVKSDGDSATNSSSESADELVALILELPHCSAKQLLEHVKYFDDKNLADHPRLNEHIQQFKLIQTRSGNNKDHHHNYQLRVYFQNYLLKRLAVLRTDCDLDDLIKISDEFFVGKKGKSAHHGQQATHPVVKLIADKQTISEALRELVDSYAGLTVSLQRLRARRNILLTYVCETIYELIEEGKLNAPHSHSFSSDERPSKRQRLEAPSEPESGPVGMEWSDALVSASVPRSLRLFVPASQKLQGFIGHEPTMKLLQGSKRPRG